MADCPVRKPSVVPFVNSWSAELPDFEDQLVVNFGPEGPKLGYRNERETDRVGRDKVLWGRMAFLPGEGRPEFDSMHPSRQYNTMYWMKCQVCGNPASKNRDGWLFLDWRGPLSPSTWPERSLTAMPPVCDEHAVTAIEECPHLRKTDFVVLRVRTPRLWGYSGTPYKLTAEGWKAHEIDGLLPCGDPGLRGMLATRLYRELRNVTVVSGGLLADCLAGDAGHYDKN
ncbi:hypothetical protein [Streptomyces endophytica]|uniref:Uncharacterized protein n=1 Tax=Streptomyces endophytica TaxID=2991496 RepID=A0ABY6P9Z6_9ACTN|nr:hypothetical protein [Streptomyces endophytica]UZJ30621.1 hypothetical protein OJ254_09950 [Streptomyces endophytica]